MCCGTRNIQGRRSANKYPVMLKVNKWAQFEQQKHLGIPFGCLASQYKLSILKLALKSNKASLENLSKKK